MSSYSAKTLLITGANRGIGLEYVKQYAKQGYQVLATVRSMPDAIELTTLAQQFKNIQIYALNVADVDAIYALASQLSSLTIDILISNAGIYPESQLQDTNPKHWLHAFQINTLPTYYLAEAFLPQLQRSTQAKLIAMTSKMGSLSDNSSGGEYIYRSTKTALNMVVKSLAIDLRASGVTVASLHPGWVRTDMGGPRGLIDVQTSVAGLCQVIETLDLAHSGCFFAYDGSEIPW